MRLQAMSGQTISGQAIVSVVRAVRQVVGRQLWWEIRITYDKAILRQWFDCVPGLRSWTRHLQLPAMRKLAMLTIVLLACIATWVVHSKVMRSRREAYYQAQLAPFRQALPTGTPRTEVARYLDSRGLSYEKARFGAASWTYQVRIAEEPGDGLVCAKWTVYAAMEFSPVDTLTDVHVKKVGKCL